MLCLTLLRPHNRPGSSAHGISQARILVWAATSFSRGSFWPRDGSCIQASCIGGGFFTTVPPGKPFLPERLAESDCWTLFHWLMREVLGGTTRFTFLTRCGKMASRSMCTHLLLWELQNYNWLLNPIDRRMLGPPKERYLTPKGKGEVPARW